MDDGTAAAGAPNKRLRLGKLTSISPAIFGLLCAISLILSGAFLIWLYTWVSDAAFNSYDYSTSTFLSYAWIVLAFFFGVFTFFAVGFGLPIAYSQGKGTRIAIKVIFYEWFTLLVMAILLTFAITRFNDNKNTSNVCFDYCPIINSTLPEGRAMND